MFSHMMLGCADIEVSRAFYDPLFASMGAEAGLIVGGTRLAYALDGAKFILTIPLDGQPASHGNGSTVGFKMSGPEAVDAWHKAGVAAGGTPIESPPGWRDSAAGGRMYVAYLRDPDGNKLNAIFREV